MRTNVTDQAGVDKGSGRGFRGWKAKAWSYMDNLAKSRWRWACLNTDKGYLGNEKQVSRRRWETEGFWWRMAIKLNRDGGPGEMGDRKPPSDLLKHKVTSSVVWTTVILHFRTRTYQVFGICQNLIDFLSISQSINWLIVAALDLLVKDALKWSL